MSQEKMLTNIRKDIEERISVDRQHGRVRRAQKGDEGQVGPMERPKEPRARAEKGVSTSRRGEAFPELAL